MLLPYKDQLITTYKNIITICFENHKKPIKYSAGKMQSY
jgi:hypothetical protein